MSRIPLLTGRRPLWSPTFTADGRPDDVCASSSLSNPQYPAAGDDLCPLALKASPTHWALHFVQSTSPHLGSSSLIVRRRLFPLGAWQSRPGELSCGAGSRRMAAVSAGAITPPSSRRKTRPRAVSSSTYVKPPTARGSRCSASLPLLTQRSLHKSPMSHGGNAADAVADDLLGRTVALRQLCWRWRVHGAGVPMVFPLMPLTEVNCLTNVWYRVQ
jgi:hypothetical protein